jgi:hypothetical protein
MQLGRRWSDEPVWLATTTQIRLATRFANPPVAANDDRRDGLLRAIARATSWLMAEIVFGFSVCGTAAHPCLLHPSWGRDGDDPVERRF